MLRCRRLGKFPAHRLARILFEGVDAFVDRLGQSFENLRRSRKRRINLPVHDKALCRDEPCP